MKSLGQVAYEKNAFGGVQNWGPWEKAPQAVRDSHEELAKIVVRTYRQRLKAAILKAERLTALLEYNASRD